MKLCGFEGGFRDTGLGGELGRVEQAAKGDGNLLFKQQTDFGGELMLAGIDESCCTTKPLSEPEAAVAKM